MEAIVLRDVKKAKNATSLRGLLAQRAGDCLRTDSQLFHSRWAMVAHSRAQLSIKHIEL